MVNILLNYYNFDGEWAKKKLEHYVKGRVLIVPLAFREWEINDEASWQAVYGTSGTKYENIMRPFAAYGIERKNIAWLDYFDESADFKAEIESADLLFFCGGMPEKAIARLKELKLVDVIKNFKGVVMGASAGAMLQLDKYHITPDEDYDEYGIWNGLGLVHGLDLEVHFLATELQEECSERASSELSVPVYQIWHEGGLLIDGGKIEKLGSVAVVRA